MFEHGGSSVDIYGHVLLGRSMHIGTLSHKTLEGRLQQPLARQNAQKCRLQGWLALKGRKTGKLLLRSRVDVVYTRQLQKYPDTPVTLTLGLAPRGARR